MDGTAGQNSSARVTIASAHPLGRSPLSANVLTFLEESADHTALHSCRRSAAGAVHGRPGGRQRSPPSPCRRTRPGRNHSSAATASWCVAEDGLEGFGPFRRLQGHVAHHGSRRFGGVAKLLCGDPYAVQLPIGRMRSRPGGPAGATSFQGRRTSAGRASRARSSWSQPVVPDRAAAFGPRERGGEGGGMEAVEQFEVALALHVLGQMATRNASLPRPTSPAGARCRQRGIRRAILGANPGGRSGRRRRAPGPAGRRSTGAPSWCVASHAGSSRGPYVLRSERNRRHATLA